MSLVSTSWNPKLTHPFQTAKFLTEEERAFVVHRLKYDGSDGQDTVKVAQSDEFGWNYVRAAFSDWQIWVNILLYMGYVVRSPSWTLLLASMADQQSQAPLYGISLFLPTIIKELGYKSTTAQLLTVPIYVAASIMAVSIAYLADWKRTRAPFIIINMLVMLTGFTMCRVSDKPGVVYAGVFIAACAIYPTQPTNISWLSNNLSGSYKRAVGMGIQISVGNLSGGESLAALPTFDLR